MGRIFEVGAFVSCRVVFVLYCIVLYRNIYYIISYQPDQSDHLDPNMFLVVCCVILYGLCFMLVVQCSVESAV